MEKYNAKSIVISRKPLDDNEERWAAFIGLFVANNPHLRADAPFKVLEIEDIEKIRIKELRNISYYLAGNDIVINNLVEVIFEEKDGILEITGEQELPKI